MSHRRLDIQGLRGLAVLLVVAFHAGLPVPGGFVGVDVFFVISGFVITGLLLRHWTDDRRIDLQTFYIRRIRRLLPALAFTVVGVCLVALLIQPPNGAQQQTAQTALGAMLLSANLVIPRLAGDYFAPTATDNPLLHTWSLSVEEQFYLVFPSLLLLGLTLARRARRPLAGAVLIVLAASLASIAFLFSATYAPMFLSRLAALANPFYSSLARAWEFGVGALLALGVATLARVPTRLLTAAGLVGTAAVLASSVILTSGTRFPGTAVFLPVVGAALMIASGVRARSWLARALSIRPLVWIGDLSYSWYLWHWPFIVFSRLLAPELGMAPLVAGAASLAPAYLSYRFVENPIRFAPRYDWKRLVAVAGGGAIVIAGALGYGARAGWGEEWALGSHVAMQRDCDAASFDPGHCTWTTPNPRGSVLLLGDSQAWALADGLIPAAASLGFETIVGSANNCPFALAGEPGTFNPMGAPSCTAHNAAVLQYTMQRAPRVAVIANQSVAYATGHVENWRASLSRGVQRLRQAGASVIIVHVAPGGDEASLRTSLLLRHGRDRSTLLADQQARRHDAMVVDQLVAAENPGVLLFDPADVLCDAVRCVTARDGRQYYTDTVHLSRSGALLLEQPLRKVLSRAVASPRG